MFERVKNELAQVNLKLADTQTELEGTKLNLKREEKVNNKLKELLTETQSELENSIETSEAVKVDLEATTGELEETKINLEREQKLSQKLKCLFRESETQLKYALEEIAEKSVEIKKMEDVLIKLDGEIESDVDDEDQHDLDDGLESIIGEPLQVCHSRSTHSGLLSPIVEENPDDVPGYYDECESYAASLYIAIGSDSKISESDIDDSQKKIKNATSSASDKENQNQPQKPKKKRQKFKVLFGLAHF